MIPVAKLIALTLSILSLLWLLAHAFFVPGSPWQDRMLQGIAMVGLSGSICFAGGLVFELPNRKFDPEPPLPLTQTLPVRLFLGRGTDGSPVCRELVSGGRLRSADLEEPAALKQITGDLRCPRGA